MMGNTRHLAAFIMACLAMILSLTIPAISSSAPGSVLAGAPQWETYKQRFITSEGWVRDNANGGISHSESQGFGMILSLAADDRATFDKIWYAAQSTLQIRKDKLFAWRYDPRSRRPVSDRNNASDGDILIAWALLEAGERGWGKSYTDAGLAIVRDIGRLLLPVKGAGRMILPGAYGFKKSGRLIVNPSYWVFPAFQRFEHLASHQVWGQLRNSGMNIIQASIREGSGAPPDWMAISLGSGELRDAPGMSNNFSWDAIRVPLYLLWAGGPAAEHGIRILQTTADNHGKMHVFNRNRGRQTKAFGEAGYDAMARLAACVTGKGAPLSQANHALDRHYYPATLRLLTDIVARTRYPQCA